MKNITKQENSISLIIDNLPDPTFAIDINGVVIAWNHTMEEVSGVKAKDMVGKGNFEYSVPIYGTRRPVLIDLILNKDLIGIYPYASFITENNGDRIIAEVWTSEIKDGKKEEHYIWAKAAALYGDNGEIIGAIQYIHDITERKQLEQELIKAKKDLENKNIELQEMNSALKVLLKKREGDQKEFEEKMISNLKILILPYLEKLKSCSEQQKMTLANIIQTHIDDILSPFSRSLNVNYSNLTNRDIMIADLIQQGKSTKEIAILLNLSIGSVNTQRYRIRRKLNLTKKNNLQIYLSSLK